jgi:hypothetical protein
MEGALSIAITLMLTRYVAEPSCGTRKLPTRPQAGPDNIDSSTRIEVVAVLCASNALDVGGEE